MFRNMSISTVLQSSINAECDNKVGEGEGDGNKTNLSNPSASKKSIWAGYLTFKGAKKSGNNPNSGGGNTKRNVKAAKGSDYITSGTKKIFNLLWYTFTHTLILQHFVPKWHIKIETDTLGHAIDRYQVS